MHPWVLKDHGLSCTCMESSLLKFLHACAKGNQVCPGYRLCMRSLPPVCMAGAWGWAQAWAERGPAGLCLAQGLPTTPAALLAAGVQGFGTSAYPHHCPVASPRSDVSMSLPCLPHFQVCGGSTQWPGQVPSGQRSGLGLGWGLCDLQAET